MVATLDNTLGAAYIGTIAAAILFGITALQVLLYYQNYPNDWKFQKISVAALMILDTFHLALTIIAVYHYCITEYGNPKSILFIDWSFKLQIAVNVVIVLLVQTLYAIRVWKLGHHFSRIWPYIVIFTVAVGYAIGITLAVKIYQISAFAALYDIRWVVYASFSTSTLIDIIIAIIMCFYLQRSRTAFLDTNFRILTIMKYILVSGFFTSACSLCALITYATMPENLVFLGVEFLLTKLYINSFIAMLNARKGMRDKETSQTSGAGVSKIMNLRSTTQNQDIESNDLVAADDKNAIHLTTVSYHGRHRDFDSDLKAPRDEISHGISVHRTVERRTDDEYLDERSHDV